INDSFALDAEDLSNDLFIKRQLIPFPRQGRDLLKRQGLIPSPRVGRGRAGGLIPSPRVGRASTMTAFPEWRLTVLRDIFDQSGTNYMHDDNVILPNLGRTKRSATDQASYTTNEAEFEVNKAVLSDSAENTATASRMQEMFNRNVRQLIPAPRVGRRSDSSSQPDNVSISGVLKAFSAPIDDEMYDMNGGQLVYSAGYGKFNGPEVVRRASFTPRIGRAFTPRIGRSFWDNNDDYVYNRLSRASFTPRIGRSVHGPSDKGVSDDNQTDSKA
ncbi:uncharacterized protein B4U79_11232, partial [Dinothrombium tinctorium]